MEELCKHEDARVNMFVYKSTRRDVWSTREMDSYGHLGVKYFIQNNQDCCCGWGSGIYGWVQVDSGLLRDAEAACSSHLSASVILYSVFPSEAP